MAFFSVPAHPVASDIADAFALAMLSGLAGIRSDFSSPDRLWWDQALKRVESEGLALREHAAGWSRSHAPGAGLQCAVILSGACLAGLIEQDVPLDQGLAILEEHRSTLVEWGDRLAQEPTSEFCAVLLGGVLRGLLARGATSAEALSDGRVHGFTCSEEVGQLRSVFLLTPEDQEPWNTMGAAAQVMSVALAGLVGRGMPVGTAFLELQAHRSLVLSSARGLVSSGSGSFDPFLPGVQTPHRPRP